MEVLILIPEAIYKTCTFTGMGCPVRFLYTALLIEIYLVDTSSALCSRQNIRKFSSTTGQTEAKLRVAPPWDRGKDGKLVQII